MDKVLKLYKIPEQEYILKVLAVTNVVPTEFSVGDFYINTDDVALYQAMNYMSVLQWVEVPMSDGLYYMCLSKGFPEFYKYDNTNNEIIEYDAGFTQNGKKSEITLTDSWM